MLHPELFNQVVFCDARALHIAFSRVMCAAQSTGTTAKHKLGDFILSFIHTFSYDVCLYT